MSGADHRRDLLQAALVEIRALKAELARARAAGTGSSREPIAVVGMACRFPGAETPAAYLHLLRAGRAAITPPPLDRWAPGLPALPGGYLPDIAGFDADLFGIAPREALRMDPQQRLLLEVVWEALEDAGLAPDSLAGSATGVFVGIMAPEYGGRQLRSRAGVDAYTLTGNDLSFPAGRVAYQFGLQGPAMAVATACSSSLVAVHLASQALRAGECGLALAGGVNLIVDPATTGMLLDMHALAPDGRCKTFAAAADGYGRGEGCGVVVLERLEDARRHGRRILGLVLGSAVNHDGPSGGLTVPSGSAQEKLLRQAWERAGIAPGGLGYCEAHGTGTALGDPIEIGAVARALGRRTAPLPIGSVKANIGHLEAAAGVAGLLKVLLALRHGQIFPHRLVGPLNPHVPWSELPLRIPEALEAWPAASTPRLAAVSSFGISGVNAHVVVQEPPEEAPPAPAGPAQLRLSAHTESALRRLAGDFARHWSEQPEISAPDLAFTLARGRAALRHTAVVEADTRERGIAQLQALAAGAALQPAPPAAPPAAGQLLGGLPPYPFERQRFWALDDDAPPVAAAGTAAMPAPMASSLAEAVQRVLGASQPVDADAPLTDLGLDSLMAMELQVWFQQVHGREVALARILSDASIAQLEAEMGAPARAAEPAPAAPRSADGGLSLGQRAMWFIQQSAPASAAYNVGVALRLPRGSDAGTMRAALEVVWARHAVLQSVYAAVAGAPRARPATEAALAWEAEDARGSDAPGLSRAVEESYRRPFDLATGPVLRAHWFEAGEGPVLLLAVHHIACDARSFQTLLQELAAAYAALAARQAGRSAQPSGAPRQSMGRPAALAPAPRPYADFVAWQQQWLAGPRCEASLAFWSEALRGAPPALDLATDFARPAEYSYRGASVRGVLSPEGGRAVRLLSERLRATPFAVLLSAYYVMLWRFSRQEDIVVGSAVAARPPGFESTVGYFVNPLPLRARLDAAEGFAALVERTREMLLGALDHPHLPFARLVEHLRCARDASRTPLYQVDFGLLKSPPVSGALREWQPFAFPEEEGQFDLGLHALEHEGRITAALKYNSDLFRRETVGEMGRFLDLVLNDAAADPARRLDELGRGNAAEQERRAARGIGPAVSWGPEPLTRALERRAAALGSAIAVECHQGPGVPQRLGYRELETRANQLARHLALLGLGAGDRIGVLLRRSLDLPVALLAVLKASAAFVPLDPAYPIERQRYLIEDSGMRALISTPVLTAKLGPLPAGVQLVSPAAGNGLPGEPLESAPGLEDLAYVLYTSGSTGQPKGAMIPHRGLLNYVHWSSRAYLGAGEEVPLHGSIAFDATLTSIFPPLLAGKRIAVLAEGEGLEPLRAYLARHPRCSMLKITPAHMQGLVALLPAEAIAAAAHVLVVGGEALGPAVLQAWRRSAPDTRIFNEYGPTETVVGCCVAELDAGGGRAPVPIGAPIANTRLYVLDANGFVLPPGAPGELCIAGEGVGRGYLNRAGLTAQRFVPDPARPGAAMYRSGDWARWGAGGLEFLGRADDQIKLRGHRIEPGEIEACLCGLPGIREAAVVLRSEGAEPQLVAYLVADDAVTRAQGWESGLRRALAARLPAALVPARMVALARLPLTAHGKLDRAALPAPAHAAPGGDDAGDAPRDVVELRLAAAWERLLDLPRVGIHQNFFDLGGHSLLAVRLLAELEADFGALPLTTILRAPTVAGLARELRASAPAPGNPWIPLHAGGGEPPVYCVPGAGGNAIYLQALARALGPRQPVFGLLGRGIEGTGEPHTSVEEMAAYAEAALLPIHSGAPVVLAGHSLGGWIIAALAHRLVAAGREVDALIVIDTPAPGAVPPHTGDHADWDQARWIAELGDRIGQLLAPGLALSADALRQLSPDAQLEAFRRALVEAGLYPAEGRAAALAPYVWTYAAHSRISYTLPPGTLPGRLLLLRTAHAPHPCLAADPTWGWGRHGEVEVREIPGEHLSALRPPHVAALAREIHTFLKAVPA